MDSAQFDRLTRRVGSAVSRRAVLGAVAGALLATVAGTRSGAAACLGIGARCGSRGQAGCGSCCTGYAPRPPHNDQRRCSCRPDFKRCARPDHCCSGLCERVRCEGIDEPICLPGLFGPDPCSARSEAIAAGA